MQSRFAAVCLTIAALAACRPDPCPDGTVTSEVVLTKGGIGGGWSWNSRDVTPYSEPSPIAHCTVIPAIFIAEDGAKLRDTDFAAAVEIGGIGTDPGSGSSFVTMPDIEGFDSVERLGGISGVVSAIAGFNHVVTVGSLSHTGADVSGFNSVTEFGAIEDSLVSLRGLQSLQRLGRLDLEWLSDERGLELPSLEEVDQEISVEQMRGTSVELPRLRRVGGNMRLDGARSLTRFRPAASSARVDGSAIFTYNAPITNEEILGWLSTNDFQAPSVIVCGNGVDVEQCPDNRPSDP